MSSTLPPLLTQAFKNAGISLSSPSVAGTTVTEGGKKYFAKTSSNVPQAIGEAESLKHMALTAPSGFVPAFYGIQVEGNKAGMVSEHFDLGGRKDQKALGEMLAEMHRPPPAGAEGVEEGKYGFAVPTFCGETRQDNTWTEDWKTFFTERRVGDLVRRLGDRDVSKLWEEMKAG